MEILKDKTYYQRKGVCIGLCDMCLYARLCASGRVRQNKEMVEFEKMRRFMQGFGIKI